MSGNAHERMIELLDEAGQTYFQAMKSGLKMQQDVAAWWSDRVKAAGDDRGFDGQQMAAEAMKQWQANADRAMALMEASTKQSMDLLGKAFTVGQADSVEAAQKKLNELCESSLQAMQDNMRATIDANKQIAEAWMKLADRQAAHAGSEGG